MGSILDCAKEDMQDITSDLDGFAVSVKLESPDSKVAEVSGIHAKHHLGIDTNTLLPINTKTASVGIAENLLTEVGYPVRNENGEVDLEKHKVDIIDSTGEVKLYVVREWYPDEMLGLIVLILGSRE